MDIPIGTKGTAETTVTKDQLAITVGSGDTPVFSTPSLTNLMEQAAVNALEGMLPPEKTTVGAHMNLSHLAATPEGMKVIAKAKVISFADRRIEFEVTAFDEVEQVGIATHTRAVVTREHFIDRTNNKLSKKETSE